MFQNISGQVDTDEIEYSKQNNKKNILKGLFTIQNIMIYILSLMVSMVSCGESMAPFGLAMLAAVASNGIPTGIVYIITMIGTFIGFGAEGVLNYLITSLIFIAMVLIFKPKIKMLDETKLKLGKFVVFSVLIVEIVKLFFNTFMVYDLLLAISVTITTYIFYKIFSNSLIVIKDYGIKKAFSIEEVVGASMLLSVAVSAFGNLSIFGLEIRNVLSILIVLILGWKNGILLGATSGVTIGAVIGIVSNGEPSIIAAYAISGMIAGIFNRLGKLGVVIGFFAGNVLLTYVTNGNTMQIIYFKEILVASLGLLLVPNSVEINLEEFFSKSRCLPTNSAYALEGATVEKLNNVSEAIKEMSDTYKEVAATVIEEEDITYSNRKMFIEELQNQIEAIPENFLYEEITDGDEEILIDLFNKLYEKSEINNDDLIEIFENHNNYIIGFENNLDIEKQIKELVKIINNSYKISKVNFIWNQKVNQNKKNISQQLNGVSKVISSIASEIKEKEISNFQEEKEQIKAICKQKQINILSIDIKREKTNKYIITVYTDKCKKEKIEECPTSKIEKIISKVLNDEIILQKENCVMDTNQELCKQIYVSKDKYELQIGMAKKTKDNISISGDSSIKLRLEDGKYLLAISDGMGSGPEARKSSQIAIKMLKRLLSTGFDKDTSIELINSTIALNTKEDMYATLDIAILDLYSGNIEFIKNGSAPTYIKTKQGVDLVKSSALPAGIMEKLDLVVYDRDLEEDDIIVMCTDGIIDSNTEYQNSEEWVKELLTQIATDNVQKIADIILKEAIDNNYGQVKDDMTVIVGKIRK